MNKQPSMTVEAILVGRSQWEPPVSVPLASYLQFSQRMDTQLRRLVACWLYTAAPIARGIGRTTSHNRRLRSEP